MTRDTRTETLIGLLIAVLLLAFAIWVRVLWVDCNDRGGTLVKNFAGWPVCINANKP